MKKYKKISNLMLAISFALFSAQQILPEYYIYKIFIVVTIGVVFFIFLSVLAYSEFDIFSVVKKHKRPTIIAAFVSLSYNYWQIIENAFQSYSTFRTLPFYLVTLPSSFLIALYVILKVKHYIFSLFKRMNRIDIYIYIGITVLLSAIVCVLYLLNPKFYLQYDTVYSIDAGWCINNIYPNHEYYDIRHPLLSVIAYPLWTTVRSLLFLFHQETSLSLIAIVLQWLNIQMLLLSAMMLKTLTQSRVIFLLYICSCPSILFGIILEKYVICVFFVLLYVYWIIEEEEDASSVALVYSMGAMPTNIFAISSEAFTKKNVRDKVLKLSKIIIAGVFSLVFWGRGFLLNPKILISHLTNMHSAFGSENLTLVERVFALLNMVEASIVALPSSIIDEKYIWENVNLQISPFSLVVVVVMIIGAISLWDKIFTKICALWCLFSAILLIVLNWAPYESPLFSIIFSWAIITLFAQGIGSICEKIKFQGAIWTILFGIILHINVMMVLNICRFLNG